MPDYFVGGFYQKALPELLIAPPPNFYNITTIHKCLLKIFFIGYYTIFLLYNKTMENKKRKISIIGSTGSIGTQALEVIEKLQDKFEIIALAGGHNKDLLQKQAEKF